MKAILIFSIIILYYPLTVLSQSRVKIGLVGGTSKIFTFWETAYKKPDNIKLQFPAKLNFGISAHYILNNKYGIDLEIKRMSVARRLRIFYLDSMSLAQTSVRQTTSYGLFETSLLLTKNFKKSIILKKYNSFWSLRIGPAISWRPPTEFNNINLMIGSIPGIEANAFYTFKGNSTHFLLKAGITHQMRLANEKIVSIGFNLAKGFSKYFRTRIIRYNNEYFFSSTGDYIELSIAYLFSISRKKNSA